MRLAAVALALCDFQGYEALVEETSGEILQLPPLRAGKAEMLGDYEEALALASTPEIMRDASTGALGGVVHASLARIYFNRGEVESAQQQLTEWEHKFPDVPREPTVSQLASLVQIDECLPALGDDDAVREVYDEMNHGGMAPLQYSASTGRGVDHIRGALALRMGLVDQAAEHYRTGLEWAERERCPIEQGRCHQGLADARLPHDHQQRALA